MAKKDLTPEDWLNLGLSELAERGYSALKAQPLSNKLGVTRGSFYYHFNNLHDFNTKLINHWSVHSSGGMMAAVKEQATAKSQLTLLLSRAFRSGEKLERAVRHWASIDEHVANAVSRADRQRLEFTTQLLIRAGLSPHIANRRSKLLYWSAIGRLMMMDPAQRDLSDEDIAALVDELLD